MWDNGNNGGNNLFIDWLNVLSFILGVENYKLNEQQSAELMKELYNNQDSMLQTIIDQNKIIIEQDKVIIQQNEELLKELKNLRK